MSLLSDHVTSAISGETTKRKVPEHGNFYFGYSHMGPTHCQFRFSEATTPCNPESLQTSNFSGWNGSIEKKYLRYFGAVADFGGQYGPLSQSSFLFGLRGSAAIGRFQPFAQALVGAIHTRGEIGKSGSQSYTSFAEDLGVGIDSRMTRLLSWRIQADEIETWLQPVKGHNTRLSSGLVVRF